MISKLIKEIFISDYYYMQLSKEYPLNRLIKDAF